jgi:hypothetical protein
MEFLVQLKIKGSKEEVRGKNLGEAQNQDGWKTLRIIRADCLKTA